MNYQKNISLFHLATIYKILLKRIGKGFTASELSFLIGKDATYINQVEMLRAPLYGSAELIKIAAALEESSAEDLFPVGDYQNLFPVVVESYQQEQSFWRSYSSVNEQEDQKLLFLLKEEVLPEFENDPAEAINVEMVKNMIWNWP